MRMIRVCCAGVGLAVLGMAEARGQGVAFQPVVNSFPNGVSLSTTPVVSLDRRYVRLTVNPQFTALEGFQNFVVPGAVGGGPSGPGALAGAGLGGLAGRNGLMAVPIKPDPKAEKPRPRIVVDPVAKPGAVSRKTAPSGRRKAPRR